MHPEKHESYGFDRPHTSFSDYRSLLDLEPGLMRLGVLDQTTYDECLNHPSTLIGSTAMCPGKVVIATPNEVLHLVEEGTHISDRLFSVLPSHYFSENMLQKDLVLRDRITLSSDTTEKIFAGDSTFLESVNHEVDSTIEGLGRRNLGDNFNEYMFISKYDFRPLHEKFSKPAEDIETPNGYVLTTRPEEIKKYTPEIVNLQREVFTSQAIQTGYYAGISDEATLSMINNPEFIPIIARDKNTNEVVMCALFSPDFTDFDSLTFINPNDVGKHMLENETPDCLALPLIVVTTLSGVGFLKYAVQMAMHETAYRKKPDTLGVMYESSSFSVHVTPRTIHGQILKAGGKCLFKHSEVYFMSEVATSAIS